jgi:hypothetical protein
MGIIYKIYNKTIQNHELLRNQELDLPWNQLLDPIVVFLNMVVKILDQWFWISSCAKTTPKR